jgi:hypothetical protein
MSQMNQELVAEAMRERQADMRRRREAQVQGRDRRPRRREGLLSRMGLL